MAEPSKKRSRKKEEKKALENMLVSFRKSELKMLLGYVGQKKSGRKPELLARVLKLPKLHSTPVQTKIKDLYKSIQTEQAGSIVPFQQQQQQTQANPAAGVSLSSSAVQQHPPQQRYLQVTVRKMQMPTAFPPSSTSSTCPIQHPDVKLKRLPFFDMMAELLQPSKLVPQGRRGLQEAKFVFSLTSEQVRDIVSARDLRPGKKAEYKIQVQIRFCLLASSYEQDDCVPSGILVKVNGVRCPLPNPIPTNKFGVEPKRPPLPVNITTLLQLKPEVANHITVSWNTRCGRDYAMAAYLVRKLTSPDLLQRLQARDVRHSDFTRDLIKKKLSDDADCEIATTSLSVSLVCPLGQMRMTTPCRAFTCYHLQCFDASLYIQINEQKPAWMCPVCNKPALFENLFIDGYFHEVLQSGKLPADGTEIQLHQDGSWSSPVIEKNRPQYCPQW